MAEVEKEEDLEKDELMEACDMDPSEKRTLAMFLRTYSNKKKVTWLFETDFRQSET